MDPTAYLAAIVASSEDAIVSKDLDGIITFWNKAAEQMFGFTADEAVGRSIRIIIPHDRQHEEDRVLAAIRSGSSLTHFETVRQRKDGGRVDISLTVSPIHGRDGRVIGASKIARDITERKRTEAALAALAAEHADLQQRLLALVAASGSLLGSPRVDDVLAATIGLADALVSADGYAVWRLDAGAWRMESHSGISSVFASHVISSHKGQPAGAAWFAEPVVAEDVDALPLLDERRAAYRTEGIRSLLTIPLLIRGERTGTLAFYFRTPHTFSEVEIKTAQALGNLAAAAITTAELHDEQRMAHRQTEFLARAGGALASSLDYRQTLKQIAELAVPHIADWCAVDVADEGGRFERLTVAPVDPARVDLARRFNEMYPPEPDEPFGTPQVGRTGAPARLEQLTADTIREGARDPEHAAALQALGITSLMYVPIRARTGTVGALTFVSAESGRRYTEADLRFAEAVAGRAGLAVENARAYEEARRANRVKDDFLATLSHELRTPLNAIMGYARMLRTGALAADRQQRAIETVERNASSLAQIVEDVLDVSRITSGKLRLHVAPVSLGQIIADAMATVSPAAHAKGVHLEMAVAPDTRTLHADADRLQQVLWNLLTNAVKFTDRGGRVEVRAHRSDDEHIDISVTDTGSGIPPAFLPLVFDRFSQGDSRFSREHGGLGLGLAIARHIVEMHGGTITAASEGQNRGATFHIRLPTTPGVPAELESAAAVESRGQESTLAGITVLAVDDDRDALALVRDILTGAGARVIPAFSASEALASLAADMPDVIVSDLGMPGMDGLELLRRIRSHPAPAVATIPAVALTAYARSDDRILAQRVGYQLHLAKPIDPVTIVRAVASLVRPVSDNTRRAG